MPTPLFLLFSALMLGFGVGVVALRNPVSSALCLVVCFVGLAGLFIGLDAFFLGVVQILVYAGAVMVLFLFIIMLLDIRAESQRKFSPGLILAGVLFTLALSLQVIGVISDHPAGRRTLDQVPLQHAAAAQARAEDPTALSVSATADLKEGRLPDVKLVGERLFTRYHLHLQVVAVLLTVASVGVVVLSRRDEPGPEDADPEPEPEN